MDNKILEPDKEARSSVGRVECRERLGGVLWYYYRQTARARNHISLAERAKGIDPQVTSRSPFSNPGSITHEPK
jgi:hypothetical protein